MAFLENILPAGLWERAKGIASGHQYLVIAAAALVLALPVLLLLWTGQSGYAVLFSGLSEEDGGRIVDELQKSNVPYRVNDGGREILVPASDLGRTRLMLASRGVPKQNGNEWTLFDNESLGVSSFVEQAHYMRGLEASLAKTIGDINGVAAAHVTLAVPQRTAFLENQPKPSASVMVQLESGVSLSHTQLDGIVHLVSSSIPGLTPDAVTVVDQNGRMLTRNAGDTVGEVPEQLSIVHDIDQRYETLIESMLTPVVGKGNVRVTVDTNVDFSHARKSSIVYGQAHVLSQDQSSRERMSGETPTGVPGALSNEPPGTPNVPFSTNNGQDQRIQLRPPPGTNGANDAEQPIHLHPPQPPGIQESHDIVNYDIDRTMELADDAPWRVNSVAVSVLINNQTGQPMSVENIAAIKSLVLNAVGAVAKRDVAVIDLPFDGDMNAAVLEPWWRQQWVHMAIQNAALALAGLFALFGFGLPVLRRLRQTPLAYAHAGAAAAIRPARPGQHGSQPSEETASEESQGLDVSSIGQGMLEADIEAVRKIVANDPGRTAQVIKEWLTHGRSNRRFD